MNIHSYFNVILNLINKEEALSKYQHLAYTAYTAYTGTVTYYNTIDAFLISSEIANTSFLLCLIDATDKETEKEKNEKRRIEQ